MSSFSILNRVRVTYEGHANAIRSFASPGNLAIIDQLTGPRPMARTPSLRHASVPKVHRGSTTTKSGRTSVKMLSMSETMRRYSESDHGMSRSLYKRMERTAPLNPGLSAKAAPKAVRQYNGFGPPWMGKA